MSLLISLLIFVVICAVVWWIIGMIPLPAPAKQIVLVILAVIALIYLVGMLTGGSTVLYRL